MHPGVPSGDHTQTGELGLPILPGCQGTPLHLRVSTLAFSVQFLPPRGNCGEAVRGKTWSKPLKALPPHVLIAPLFLFPVSTRDRATAWRLRTELAGWQALLRGSLAADLPRLVNPSARLSRCHRVCLSCRLSNQQWHHIQSAPSPQKALRPPRLPSYCVRAHGSRMSVLPQDSSIHSCHPVSVRWLLDNARELFGGCIVG